MEAEVTKKIQALKGLLQVEKQTEQSSKGRPAWPNGWRGRDQLRGDLVWDHYASSRFAWARPGLPPLSHSIIVYCIPFDSHKVSLLVQYMTQLPYLQGRGRNADFIYFNCMDFVSSSGVTEPSPFPSFTKCLLSARCSPRLLDAAMRHFHRTSPS